MIIVKNRLNLINKAPLRSNLLKLREIVLARMAIVENRWKITAATLASRRYPNV